jgi:hypothetical protein
VLAVIVVVQQLESNILQPVLQGRSLRLHAGIVLLAVTAGGTLFGITGAFLAVPLAAAAVSVLRYISEQISLRTGELRVDDLALTTSEGTAAARRNRTSSASIPFGPQARTAVTSGATARVDPCQPPRPVARFLAGV